MILKTIIIIIKKKCINGGCGAMMFDLPRKACNFVVIIVIK